MLPWRGNGGRGATRDCPGPEKVRGPPNNLEGTRLTQFFRSFGLKEVVA